MTVLIDAIHGGGLSYNTIDYEWSRNGIRVKQFADSTDANIILADETPKFFGASPP
jgi:hypothetical protein